MRFAVPIVVLVMLLGLLGYGLLLDPRVVPSPLIGKPAPAFDLPLLGQPGRLTHEDLKGRPLLVNFFASWCAGCIVEHALLMRIAAEVEILGVDYKDTDEAAAAWLARRGNPYRTVVADTAGVAGLDWGVYGVPETYVLDAGGTILHKHIGPLTEEAWTGTLQPLLAAPRQGQP